MKIRNFILHKVKNKNVLSKLIIINLIHYFIHFLFSCIIYLNSKILLISIYSFQIFIKFIV